MSEIVSAQDFSKQQHMGLLLEKVVIRGFDAKNLDHYHAYLHARFLLDFRVGFWCGR